MEESKLEEIKKEALEEKVPIIMDDTLKEIEKRMVDIKPTKILEIGTAVGYSAICFSKFLNKDGKIDTIERDENSVKKAKTNIENMNLSNVINIYFRRCCRYFTNIKRKI